jgi:protein ImuA
MSAACSTVLPEAPPPPSWSPYSQSAAAATPLLGSLRDRIAAIERSPAGAFQTRPTTLPASSGAKAGWTLGDATLDGWIGPDGLETGAVHEIKPGMASSRLPHAGSWAAASASACRFALALAARRIATAPEVRADAPILLCIGSRQIAELGVPYGPGFQCLGLDPARVIVVEPARPPDALWAIEEGLKSGAVALVLGLVDAVELTPARRLALASAGSETPCLLLTHPRGPSAAATATRWRIGPAPGALHPLDPEAPGTPRFEAHLERCRGSPKGIRSAPSILEWCDAAYRFRMAAGMADGAARPGHAAGRPDAAVG